jgi:hypothetical protein
MADRFYYCEFGANFQGVTEAAADDAAKDVSVRVTYDATANGKLETLKALDQIKAKILADTWPPA